MKNLLFKVSMLALLLSLSMPTFTVAQDDPGTIEQVQASDQTIVDHPTLEPASRASQVEPVLVVDPNDDELTIPPKEELTAGNIFGSLMVPILTALNILAGFLAYWIPGIRAIPKQTFRVLAFAIVAGAGFILFGVADFWQVALSYFMSTSIYEVFMKPAGLQSKH